MFLRRFPSLSLLSHALSASINQCLPPTNFLKCKSNLGWKVHKNDNLCETKINMLHQKQFERQAHEIYLLLALNASSTSTSTNDWWKILWGNFERLVRLMKRIAALAATYLQLIGLLGYLGVGKWFVLGNYERQILWEAFWCWELANCFCQKGEKGNEVQHNEPISWEVLKDIWTS